MPSTQETESHPPLLQWARSALLGLDPRGWSSSNPTAAAARGIHAMRSGLFIAESLPLLWLQRPPAGQVRKAPPAGAIEVTLARLRTLLERDAESIGQGIAPLSVLSPRDPLGHASRWLRILADTPSVATRRRRHVAKEFGRQARSWLDELPAYYRRNFHYQTDGYLSDRSADLYEHQVELLFRGGADAMRRLILPPMKAFFSERPDGQGLRFLEVGSGAGSATHSIARAFPAAKITCLDLSYPYTRHAQKQLRAYPRVECIQGDAAALEFAEDRFDAVYSVFLYHELPLPVREQVLEESLRVLKPEAFFGFVDSLQTGDDEELDWALEFFPREFHEPYYAHYAAHPMEALMAKAGFEDIESGTGYLAKWATARKPAVARPAAGTSSATDEIQSTL